MACDESIERCLQGRFNAVLESRNKEPSYREVSAEHHRLIGTEIWIEVDGEEKRFLDGVTEIEFRDGKVVFQTVLGEAISLSGERGRVTLREEGVVLRSK